MDIHKLIAGISPETYCQPQLAKQVRRQLRQMDTVSPPDAVLEAARLAEPKPANLVPLHRLQEFDPFDCPGLQSPRSQFTYTRDAFGDSLEAFYFSILNHLESLQGWDVLKLVDEFQASLLALPFADAAKQQALIQRQVFEGLEAIHTLTRDILHTLQQLEAETTVGQGIEDSAANRDSSMTRDLQLHRAQLHSQLALLKLRAATVRPWLQPGAIAAPLLPRSSSAVNVFNTAVFQVTLLALGPDVLPEAVQRGDLPRWVRRKVRKPYRPVLVLELQFRARPQHSRSQGYAYRGKVELTLTSYGLQEHELELLQQTVESSLVQDSVQIGTGQAQDALNDLIHRLDLAASPPPSPLVEPATLETNPFSALFSLLKDLFRWLSGRSRHPRDSSVPDVQPDTALEAVARSLAIVEANGQASDLSAFLKSTSHI